MSAARTPTPYVADWDGEILASDTAIARVWGPTVAQMQADCAFIVRACNSHDALVAALAEAINLRVGLYRIHEDPSEFKPENQVISGDEWLARWSAALDAAKAAP